MKSMLGWQPSYAEFFKRPVRLYQAPESTLPAFFYPYTDWANNVFVAEKLANFQGIRGTFCVRIQHNGSAFRLGKRIWAFDLETGSDPNNNTWLDRSTGINGSGRNVFELSTLPIKGYTLPWTSETLDLRIPFMYNWAFYFKQITGPLLLTRPIVPTYAMDNSAITNPITYVIYGWMEDIELVKPSRIQSDRENSYRTFSNAVGKATGIAKDFGISTTPIDIAKKFGDKVATALGYSKPTMPITSNILQAYSMSPTSVFNASAAEVVSADTWENEETVDAASLGFGADDDTDIAKLGAIPGLIRVVTLTNPVSDTCVWSEWVRPIGTNTAGVLNSPPATYIANAHNFWSGDVVFHFDVIANPFCKGLIRIEFDPGSYILPIVGNVLAPAINAVQSVIIDLNSETSATLRCPWNAPAKALLRSDFYTTPVAGTTFNTTNGTIAMYVSSPIMIANTAAPVLNVAIWQSVENFKVYEFDQRNINGFTNQWNQAQSDSAMGFGGSCNTINQLCRINTLISRAAVNTGTTGNFYAINSNIPNFPPGIYSSTGANRAPDPNWTNGGVFQTGLLYWSPMFLARRGGSRMKIVQGLTELPMQGTAIVTTNRSQLPQTPGFTVSRQTTNPANAGFSGCVNYPYVNESALQIEVRNNRRSSFPYNDARTFGGAASGGARQIMCTNLNVRTYSAAATPLTPAYLHLGYAGDDNYTLNMFFGVPSLIACTVAAQAQALPDIEDLGKPHNEAAATLLSLTRVRLQRQPQDDPPEDGDSESNDDMYSGVLSQPQSDDCLPFSVSFRGPRARLTTHREAEESSDSEDP